MLQFYYPNNAQSNNIITNTLSTKISLTFKNEAN